MNAKELKLLTGEKTKLAAISCLYKRLEGRTWKRDGLDARLAGYDDRKNLIHFCQTKSIGDGGVWHSRIGVSLENAIDCISGNLSGIEYTKLF